MKKIAGNREHEQCYYYDTPDKPIIEVVRIATEKTGDLTLSCNEVVFVMEGSISLVFDDFRRCEGVKGQVLFLLSGGHFSYHTIMPSVVMIFRILGPIHLCNSFSLEKLYNMKCGEPDSYEPDTRRFSTLEINAPIRHLLEGINDYLLDGVRCREYFDLKIHEFFILLRIYYKKEELYSFFYFILSGDTAFSEYVRLNWHRFRKVSEFASCLNITERQFIFKFKAVFGQTPYKWMKVGRAKKIMQELTGTNNPFKQIAFENGFSDFPQFTKFCKKEIGNTPTEIRAKQKSLSG